MLEKNGNIWFNNTPWEIFNHEEIFRNPYNKVWIDGVIEKDIKYDVEISALGVYTTTIRVPRLSKNDDLIPVVISRATMKEHRHDSLKGRFVTIYGQIRTQNYLGHDGKTHVRLYVYANKINVYTTRKDNKNLVYLEGNICKKPYTREKIPNKDKNTTLIIAVRRDPSKSEFIHCITWKTTSDYAESLTVGDRVKIMGRVQSRDYFMKNGNHGTAYEVSVFKLEKIEKIIY